MEASGNVETRCGEEATLGCLRCFSGGVSPAVFPRGKLRGGLRLNVQRQAPSNDAIFATIFYMVDVANVHVVQETNQERQECSCCSNTWQSSATDKIDKIRPSPRPRTG